MKKEIEDMSSKEIEKHDTKLLKKFDDVSQAFAETQNAMMYYIIHDTNNIECIHKLFDKRYDIAFEITDLMLEMSKVRSRIDELENPTGDKDDETTTESSAVAS